MAPEDMAKLTRVAGTTDLEQAEVLQAFLKDHIPADFPAAKRVQITVD